MIEARILCNESCEIKDLELDLVRGQELWIGEQLARRSKDLRYAREAGKVSVAYRVNDPNKPRRHTPPNYQRTRPNQRLKAETPKQVVSPPIPPKVERVVPKAPDSTTLIAEIKAELLGDLRGTIAQEIAKALAERPQAQNNAMTAEQMAAVMEGVLRRHGGVASSPAPSQRASQSSRDPEMPLYMPTGIVDKDAKTAISVQEESTGGDLDESTRLLREMKKRKNGDT